ncbi:MAG: 23S rRNA (guanosine(2251)-2'-O)-methyltransferase RlmB, partial [Clostridium saudiense]|nr:23S rRNA (guanosine(2251)-2'-O)-methyltransferase RlmB [Clostridium saudiense]
MTKRENPRRREREFNKFQEKSNRYQEKNNRFQDRREEKRDRNYAAGTREANSEAVREDLVIGRNAVIEALKSDRTIECL